jgi:hypothetical protein
MTETTAAPQLIDFHNLPLTTEQKILAALERIEVLLTPKPPLSLADVTPGPAAATTKLFSKARGK